MSTAEQAIGDKRHPGPDYEIVVNGRKRTVTTQVLSFDQVVALAFDPVPAGADVIFTVSYRHAAGPKEQGSLVRGETVKIEDGTVFHVTETTRS